MKKLLLLGVVLIGLQMNAQLSTIDQDFNNFTAGNNTFPQNDWSAILASNPLPYPPAPMMIVIDGDNKAVQSYSGNNSTQPNYLITPEIVAPTGDKSIKFDASLVASSPGTATIQIGLSNSATNMDSFTPIGSPISITEEAFQSILVEIPASESKFIVFQVTPTATHTAVQIDNVQYNLTTSLGTVNAVAQDLKFALSADNSSLEFRGTTTPSKISIFSAAGQNVISGSVKNQRFNVSSLQSGVYFMVIETNHGSVIKSKFIKK